ncbi:histidine phosphatase family protein [Aureimonas fodinaquatilis]|uniref:histidine phosphatase family protein n=1 Tax=Aureimonas fodinaquatilis TaxID=2565783 RepID=UPI00165DCA40|nr:histidine phosphatase family protein [Aureimonas fodinaquatilis]
MRLTSEGPLEPEQSEKLVQCLREIRHADKVFSAPEASCIETAHALSAQPEICPAFRDVDYGRWKSLALHDLMESEPDAVSAWLGDPAAAPHGGESLVDAGARISDWLSSHIDHGGHCLVVTHPTIIKLAILGVLSAPLASTDRIDVDFASATYLNSNGLRWSLRLRKPV